MPKKTTTPDKRSDRPTTQGMLESVRQELKSEMRSGFREVDSKLASMDSKIASMDSKIASMDSKIEKILTAVSQMQFNNEQQKSDNRAVIERQDILSKRLDRTEKDVSDVKTTVASLAKTKRRPGISQ